MTIEELGQKTKAAHPEYAEMDDASVGNAVVSKFPGYSSQIEQPPPPSLGSKILSGAGKVAQTGLETLASPFQVAGEAIRTAGEGGPMRAPSIIQRVFPSTKTSQPPADPFMKAYQGLEGIANLPSGIQKASDVVTGEPDTAAKLGGMALALGTGEAGNAPMTAVTKTLGAPFKLAPKLLGKLAEYSGLTKEVNPEIADAAEKFNFPVTPAGATGSGTQSSIESALAVLPFSKDPMMKRYADQLNTLKGMREQLFQNGGSTNQIDQEIEQQLASLIQDKIVGASQSAYKAAQGDYAGVGKVVEGKQIPSTNLEQTAQRLYESQAKLPSASRASGSMSILDQFRPQEIPGTTLPEGFIPGSPMAKAYLEQVSKQNLGTDIGPRKYDYPSMQGIRADLNSRIAQADKAINSGMPGMKFQSSPEAGIYKQLKGALDKDLSDFGNQSGNEGFQQALDKANSNYSTYKQTFKDNALVTSIVKQQNPVDAIKIASRALMKSNNLTESGTLQQLLGPEAYSYLSDHVANTLTSKNGQFSPTAVISNFEKLGDQSLTNILGEDKMNVYRPLYVLSKASKAAEMNAGNPSGTGRMIGAMATLIRPMLQILSGGITKGIGTLAVEATGLPTMSKAYLSPEGMNLLTKKPVNLEGITQGLGPILGKSKYAGPLLGAKNARNN